MNRMRKLILFISFGVVANQKILNIQWIASEDNGLRLDLSNFAALANWTLNGIDQGGYDNHNQP